MSDITLHFGQFIVVAESLLGAAAFGTIALLALCAALAFKGRRPPRAVAATAGALAVAELALAALSALVPESGTGDDIANILLFVWLGLFLAGLGLVIWSGVRA